MERVRRQRIETSPVTLASHFETNRAAGRQKPTPCETHRDTTPMMRNKAGLSLGGVAVAATIGLLTACESSSVAPNETAGSGGSAGAVSAGGAAGGPSSSGSPSSGGSLAGGGMATSGGQGGVATSGASGASGAAGSGGQGGAP